MILLLSSPSGRVTGTKEARPQQAPGVLASRFVNAANLLGSGLFLLAALIPYFIPASVVSPVEGHGQENDKA